MCIRLATDEIQLLFAKKVSELIIVMKFCDTRFAISWQFRSVRIFQFKCQSNLGMCVRHRFDASALVQRYQISAGTKIEEKPTSSSLENTFCKKIYF